MPTQRPQTFVTYDNSPGGPLTASGVNVVMLVDALDGPSLNADNRLIRIETPDEITRKLGPDGITYPTNGLIRAFMDMARSGLWVGRVTGAGGAKAATAAINDIVATPGTTLRGDWKGKGTNGNRFRLDISRGRTSTSDTGAGRLDTVVKLVEIATLLTVPGCVIEGNMNPASDDYLVTKWNNADLPCTLTDLSPSNTYLNTDEPAIGTYNFTGGTAPAAVSTTERTAAATALGNQQDARLALVGVHSWPAADVNTLAGVMDENWSVLVDHLADGTLSSAAATRDAALTVNRDRIASFAGWGTWERDPLNRIPGLAQVLAQAVIGARELGGAGFNRVKANSAMQGWLTFDTYGTSDLDLWAASRVNPMYRVSNRYQDGVIVGDVLSHSTAAKYAQWPSRRVDDLVLTDIMDYLNQLVALNPDYVFGTKVGGVNAPETLTTLKRIDVEVAAYFAGLPAGLLSGGRGTGWDWAGDVVNGTDGPEPQFKLGTDPARVGRIFNITIGRVAGRFTPVATETGAAGGTTPAGG